MTAPGEIVIKRDAPQTIEQVLLQCLREFEKRQMKADFEAWCKRKFGKKRRNAKRPR